MSSKLVFSWILGGVFMSLGVWIINNLKLGLGVSEFSYSIAMMIAFIFILVAGLLWINVSVAVKHRL
jgi:hypothetical protein